MGAKSCLSSAAVLVVVSFIVFSSSSEHGTVTALVRDAADFLNTKLSPGSSSSGVINICTWKQFSMAMERLRITQKLGVIEFNDNIAHDKEFINLALKYRDAIFIKVDPLAFWLIAEAFRVTKWPTFAFVNKGAKPSDYIVGWKFDKLENKIRSFINTPSAFIREVTD